MSDLSDKPDVTVDENTTTTTMTAAQLANRPQGYYPVTQEEKAMNRKVNRKLDIFILPFLSLLYLFSGLDRGQSSCFMRF